MALDRTKTVLLVIDMQNGFLGHKSKHVLPAVLRLVKEFTSEGIPSVFTRFHNPPDSQYERLIGWTRLRSSPETDLATELQDLARIVIDKEIYSSLIPDLQSMINQNEWQTFILCGVATDGCVLKTAVDLFEKGHVPIVVVDACASHAGEEVHRAGLQLLGRFIGGKQLLTTDALFHELNISESHQ